MLLLQPSLRIRLVITTRASSAAVAALPGVLLSQTDAVPPIKTSCGAGRSSSTVTRSFSAFETMRAIAIVLFVCGLTAGLSGQDGTKKAQLPRFEEFRVVASEKDPPRKTATPSLTNDNHREPNFAGRFAIEYWRSAPDSEGITITDTETGKRYGTPFIGVARCGPKSRGRFSFRADSRLLVVYGRIEVSDETESWPCGTAYYEWTGTSFRLIRRDLRQSGVH